MAGTARGSTIGISNLSVDISICKAAGYRSNLGRGHLALPGLGDNLPVAGHRFFYHTLCSESRPHALVAAHSHSLPHLRITGQPYKSIRQFGYVVPFDQNAGVAMRNNLWHCPCVEGYNWLGMGHGFQVDEAK